ncbi:hypothetical protein BC829DRAFT_444793 [Chytridium lagenaria]|nr:hypothetical protein BC829DRAFT_444793 [Chytridium lagenaria]
MTQDDDLFDDPDQYQSHPQHSHHQHQGAQRWKGLTERLVESCTPFSTGSTNFKACVDFALSSFSNNKHLTTDERKMEASYKGLVEKFDLFGDFLKAEALDNLLQAALKGPTSTFDDFKIHDVLRLLLLLSSSPLKERYEPPLEKIELTPEELWDAILSEDPLIGDHWEVQRRSSEDSNDESLYDTDIETDEERSENHLGNSPVPADETPDPDTTLYVSEVSDESNEDAGMFSLDFNIDGMRELLPLQYWTLPKKKFSCAGNRSFSADNPNSLNPALSAEQISSPSFFGIPITPTSYVNETDVLRECFSLCLGLPSEIFFDKYSWSNTPKPAVAST